MGKSQRFPNKRTATFYIFRFGKAAPATTFFLQDGAVEKIMQGKDTLYPEAQKHNVLMDYELTVKDVKNGTGDSVIGKRAYIRIMKTQLAEITPENFVEFVESRVRDSGYNWVSIVCDDGTGICFPGSMVQVADYGKLDADGSIVESYGTISLTEDGTYSYSEN